MRNSAIILTLYDCFNFGALYAKNSRVRKNKITAKALFAKVYDLKKQFNVYQNFTKN